MDSFTSLPTLFTPLTVGHLKLQHRIALAPLTRYRVSAEDHVPLPIVKKYYEQRASVPGTLLISEAVAIHPKACGHPNYPGIFHETQIKAWKEIVDAVHAKGSYIFLTLFADGRIADEEYLAGQGYDYVSASSVPLKGHSSSPRALTIPEIQEYSRLYATAARNAVKHAGFDGVEIQAAYGTLIDQFLQDVTNHRTDEYGGSIQNRSQFALQVIASVVDEVGEERTGLRLSPWSRSEGMGMSEPVPQFSHLLEAVKESHSKFAYVHFVEPGVETEERNNDFFRKIWAPRPFISCGRMPRQRALLVTDRNHNEIVASGKAFLANPDLPLRWKHDYPLNEADSATFFLAGDPSETGYTDYPFYEPTTARI